MGRTAFRQHLNPVEDKLFPIELDREVFLDGIYFVSVIYRGRVQSKRLVVARF